MIHFKKLTPLLLIISFVFATQTFGAMVVLEPGHGIKTLADNLSNPQDITTFQPGGGYGPNLFVTEHDKNQITKVSVTGIKTVLATNINYAVAILFGRGGFGNYLYVSESYSSNGNILRILPNGTKSVFCAGIDSPLDMVWGIGGAFGSDLYIASANADKIIKVDSTGNKTNFATSLDRPSVLSFSPIGSSFGDYLYFTNTDAGEVLRVDSSGTVSTFASGIDRPIGIAFGENTPFGDYLYISESATGSILKFAADGTFSIFATGFEKPVEIHFSQGGAFANNMLVVDSDAGKIVQIISLGAPFVSFTSLTADVETDPFDFGFTLTYPKGLSQFASFQFFYNGIDLTPDLIDLFIASISEMTDKKITVSLPNISLGTGTHELKVVVGDTTGKKGNGSVIYTIK